MPGVEIKKGLILDLLDTNSPALSATSDMPVVETKPDASPAPEEAAPADKPPDEGGEPESKTQGESATPPAEETAADDQPAKPARGVQKRLDELTRQREEAERRAEAERAEKLRLLALLEARKQPEGEAKAEVTEDPEPSKPSKSDFPDPDAWDAALSEYAENKAAWTARREVKAMVAEERRRAQEAIQAEATRRAQEAFKSRLDKAREKYADFAQVAESPDVQISRPMAFAIISSEDGPEIQYYLGKNPAEAQRIASIEVNGPNGPEPDVARQLVELGKIAARINAPVAAKQPVSNAPKPIAPIKSGDGNVPKSPEEMTMDEYAAYRKTQMARDMRH